MFKAKIRHNKKLLIFCVAFAAVGGVLLYKSFALNPNLPGDVNNDNKVDISDLSLLLSHYNQSYSAADFNSDGVVNILDLSILLSNYGKTYTTSTGTCNLNATTSNFAAQVTAATAGQTICLASGNYGTWSGTNKAIIIKAADGASPQMQVNFGSGDSSFTLDGMKGMGGGIKGASNITIKNSTFTDSVDFEGGSANTNVVFDHNTHNWNAVYDGGINAKIFLGSGNGTFSAPSVMIKNSEFKNGDLDGIHLGDGAGYIILNNIFDNLCDVGTNHTDNIQFDTSVVTQTRIAGNYVHANDGCGTQGITSFDHGTNGVIIENNVVDIRRPWAIELYSDVNSIVRHNTVVYYPSSQCDFNTPCGRIDIDRKTADPAGTGTQVYDNVATVEFNAGSTGTAHHNVSGQTAVYVGPTTSHDGFLLASNSPVGNNAASDGTDIGVYSNGSTPGGGTSSFPDASNTGVPAGTALTAYTGPTTITTNNTVIDGKTVSGELAIEATGVIIKNSLINGPVIVDDAANYARSNNGTTPVVTIVDSKIDCQGAVGRTGVSEAHYVVRRVEIVRCENGFDMNQNILIEDSYIHNLGNSGTDPHSDGAQCAGGRWTGSSYTDGAKNLTLRHNTIYGMSENDTQFETSAIICGTGTGGLIDVDSNLLAGGAYTLYCIRGGPGPNFRVTNNHFSTKFKSTFGAFGPTDSCHDEVISGNVVHETGALINFANDD